MGGGSIMKGSRVRTSYVCKYVRKHVRTYERTYKHPCTYVYEK